MKKAFAADDSGSALSAAGLLQDLPTKCEVVSISATRRPAWPPAVGFAPTDGIALQLKDGNVVPFLGAGASYCVRPPGASWESGQPFPPSGKELAEYLARLSNFPGTYPHDWNDLSQIASFYALRLGRKDLNRRLRDLFLPPQMKSFDPAQVIAANDTTAAGPATAPAMVTPHRVLARVNAPMLIVTTNYDMLMEQALLEAGRNDFDVVVPSTNKSFANAMLVQKGFGTKPVAASNADLPKLIDPSKRTVIYKMHGSVFPDASFDSFVITEDDYVTFLARMGSTNKVVPPNLEEHFSGRSFLFLGYGLRDWNLRLLMQNLREVLPPDPNDTPPEHWAIQYFPTQSDQALWQRRLVNIFHRDLREFSVELAAALD